MRTHTHTHACARISHTHTHWQMPTGVCTGMAEIFIIYEAPELPAITFNIYEIWALGWIRKGMVLDIS